MFGLQIEKLEFSEKMKERKKYDVFVPRWSDRRRYCIFQEGSLEYFNNSDCLIGALD
jgi:hypothetical protein